MSHFHSIYDTDAHFSINPISHTLTNESSLKTKLVRRDHNSERFTFEVPRYIEGHDMSLCNVVQIHYINIEAGNDTAAEDDTETGNETRELNTKRGLYEADDVQLSPEDEDMVIFSWVISRNATQLVGSLNFAVRFCCIPEDSDEVEYEWNTEPYVGIVVTDGIYNGDAIAEEYADVLEQWRKELFSGSSGETVVQANWNQNDETATDYVKNRPFFEETKWLLEKTDVVFEEMEGMLGTSLPLLGLPTHRQEIIVNFDGTDYATTCLNIADPSEADTLVFGNMSMMGQADTGEPFVGIASYSDGYTAMLMPLNGATSATISIRYLSVKTIDPKFLGSGDELETIDLTTAGFPTITYGEIFRIVPSPELYTKIDDTLLAKGMARFRVKMTINYPNFFAGNDSTSGIIEQEFDIVMSVSGIQSGAGDNSYMLYAYWNGYILWMEVFASQINFVVLKFTDIYY